MKFQLVSAAPSKEKDSRVGGLKNIFLPIWEKLIKWIAVVDTAAIGIVKEEPLKYFEEVSCNLPRILGKGYVTILNIMRQ